jgi:hypothetical protein
MAFKIDSLPSWIFNEDEVSPGVYRVHGTHILGPTFDLNGIHEVDIEKEAQRAAEELEPEILKAVEMKRREKG